MEQGGCVIHDRNVRTKPPLGCQVLRGIAYALFLLACGLLMIWFFMVRMSGQHRERPHIDVEETITKLSISLSNHVRVLATEIGERNVYIRESLVKAENYIATVFAALGCEVQRQVYEVLDTRVANLSVEIVGTDCAEKIVVVGAHYDSVSGSPGANDNASGVAALLELARLWRDRNPACTLRFVAFVNEEPPFFQTEQMGSYVYAEACRRRGENIVAMLSLETMGYFSDLEGTQHYPPPIGLFYPSRGNFIGVVGCTRYGWLVRKVVGELRNAGYIACEGGAFPSFIPGISWSDHWSFWQHGYPAVMITDTAPFRYPYYHSPHDTPDKLDYDRLARVVLGLDVVIKSLVVSALVE